jgi:hypothetical protein
MKCPMKTLSPQKSLPTGMNRVEISSPTVTQPVHFQLTLFADDQAN